MNEFELIERHFVRQSVWRDDVVRGIGDDGAVVDMPVGMEQVISADMLLVDVHFPATALPEDIGYKALAVNLSDLAAMGAQPAWFTLCLSMPAYDEQWLAGLSAGLFEMAQQYNMQLIGGDTTRGPLSIAIQAIGVVPKGQALLRSSAHPGDGIYLSGAIGDARLGLRCARQDWHIEDKDKAHFLRSFNRPQPRVEVGMALREIANAAIDVSDGLAVDIGHILQASGVGATIQLTSLPLSAAYKNHFHESGWEPALSGGDDYELCFTVPPEKQHALDNVSRKLNRDFYRIGSVTSGAGLSVMDEQGEPRHFAQQGYQHF